MSSGDQLKGIQNYILGASLLLKCHENVFLQDSHYVKLILILYTA